MNKYFSIHRFFNLLKRDLHANSKRNLLIIGAMFSIFTVIAFFSFEMGKEVQNEITLQKFHSWIYIAMLYIGGAFITSFSFIELRDKIRAHFYLMTPGSALEKLLISIVVSLIGYFLVITLTYFLYSLVFNWIANAIYGYQFNLVDFRNKDVIDSIKFFMAFQSVFLLGAITFKKYPVIFTPIVIFILNFIVLGFTKLVSEIIFHDINLSDHVIFSGLDKMLGIYAKIAVFYILPPVLWFITYLKLNEKEL